MFKNIKQQNKIIPRLPRQINFLFDWGLVREKLASNPRKSGFARIVDFGFVCKILNKSFNVLVKKTNEIFNILFNKQKTKILKPKFTTGFAVLFAVLLASFLITLGISIFNISLKEIMITTSIRDSQVAYYVADSASECALYWDRKGTFPACGVDLLGNPVCSQTQELKPKITCNNNDITLTFTKNLTKPIYSTGVVSPFFQASSSQISTPAADIQITKEFISTNNSITTTIDTYGHNTKILGRRIERGIRTVFESGSVSTPLVPNIPTSVTIGDFYQGGIVAYILQPGESNGVYNYDPNTQHGLIAAINDLTGKVIWGCGGTSITGADGTAIGTGKQNTSDIVAIVGGCSTAGIAAKVAQAYTDGVYHDWYMPSKEELKEELNKLYINQVKIGGFVAYYYTSSSEINASNSSGQYFVTGDVYPLPKDTAYWVRPIRSF